MLESLSHRMVGRISRTLPNVYSVLSGVYQQNSSILTSSKGQGSSLFSWHTSPQVKSLRKLMQDQILKYLKEKHPYCQWEDSYLRQLAIHLDDRLLQQATSQEDYMDLTMIVPRLESLLCSLKDFGNDFSSKDVSSPSSTIVHGTNITAKQINVASFVNNLTADLSGLYDNTYDASGTVLTNSYAYTSAVPCDSFNAINGNMATEYCQGSASFSGFEQYPYLSSDNLSYQNCQAFGRNVQHKVDNKFSKMERLVDGKQRHLGHGNMLSLDLSSRRVTGSIHPSALQAPELGLEDHPSSSPHGLCSMKNDLFTDNGEIPQRLASEKALAHWEQQLPSVQLHGQNVAWASQAISKACVDNQDLSAGRITGDGGSYQTVNTFDSEKECSMTITSLQHQDIKCLKQDGMLEQACFTKINSRSVPSISDMETSVLLSKENKTYDISDTMYKISSSPAADLHKQETSAECLKVDQLCSSNICWQEENTVNCRSISTKLTRNSVVENSFMDKPISVNNTMDLDRNYESSSQGSSGAAYDVKTESIDVSNLNNKILPVQSLEKVGSSGLTRVEVEMTASEAGDGINHENFGYSDDHVPKPSEFPRKRINGASLIEWFTPSQVREHLKSARHTVDQGKEKIDQNEELVYPVDENTCQLCGLSNICFDVPAIYCASCSNRIGRGRAYYVMDMCEVGSTGNSPQNFFCNLCYKGSHGESIKYAGIAVLKAKLKKKTNDHRAIEPWVQCDKCSSWQHQICGLFNDRRNEGEKAEYICPKCYLLEIENGERSPLPTSALLGAKSLPRSKLSDHIENRLFIRLRQEREERAMSLGKELDKVPGAENLVVRVVSSLDRKLEVKRLISDVFQEQEYPTEFSYTSKAILLFQNIEGADIFLFGMYVQEYGSNCPHPNQRYTYLSYLDSAKFFRPDVKTVNGEALRTFVYHEILLGYLEYCKIRGFTCCYIWSCPPLKREDFIFNCHPEKQKMPKSEKLREWYVTMANKGIKEGIVVHRTNLYDHFFTSSKECLATVTAARLPYFDGDYWPGLADDILNILQREKEGKEPQKKGKITISRRALKVVQNDASTGNAKDILLMDKLGDAIRPVKETFMLIHLQHTCSHCCQFIINGNQWVCNSCKNFILCDKCYEAEQKLDDKERHPLDCSEKHSLSPVVVAGVPAETSDEDKNMRSEILDGRISFLNFCQGYHYQFDALRRAKHSTMMVLHHIHTGVLPAFVASCSVCHIEITNGLGWHCCICPEYHLCESCCERVGKDHIHRLNGHASTSCRDHGRNRVKDCEEKPLLEQALLTLLQHTSECSTTASCAYPFCRHLRVSFKHCARCKIRKQGGCIRCEKIWSLLMVHSRTCNNPVCRTPRCLDIRNNKEKSRKRKLESVLTARVGDMDNSRQDEDLGS